MGDGTFKTGLDLQIGDIIRTIDIPNASNVDSLNEAVNYKIDLDTFISGSTYSTNVVTAKSRLDTTTKITEILFSDGSTWEDTITSFYLVERDNEVRFIRLSDLVSGDIVLLIDTSDNTNVKVVPKLVESTTTLDKEFSGWIMEVERRHLFLTVTDDNTQNLSYAAIEHNGPACYPPNGCGVCPTKHIICGYYTGTCDPFSAFC